MAVSALKPIIFHLPQNLSRSSPPTYLSNFNFSTARRRRTHLKKTRVLTKPSSFTPVTCFSDPFVLQIAETLEDSLGSTSSPPALQKLRDCSSESLLSTRWPTRKDEAFRFTDTSFIKQSQITPASSPQPQSLDLFVGPTETQFPFLSIVDGYVANSQSQLSQLPEGVFVGPLSGLNSDAIMNRVLESVSNSEGGDLFSSINGVGAPDLIVVYVPAECKMEENPIHLRFVSVEGANKESKKLPISNPRVLVLVEKGAKVGIVEEHLGGRDVRDKCYWANSVMEVVVGEGAQVSHSYIQSQSLGAVHMKWTSVRQEANSSYELIEVSTGGKLSRHNVHVQQVGPETVTNLSTFHLSGNDQTQDLHSKLVLDHPEGKSNQVHKCIVAHSSGQAVFDGNIKVNRYAQRTDANQMTRSLLLERGATVNVKPNLQIIADDVKCTHGAAISDLEKDQLLYFQARGIDLQTARKAFVFSFGREVIRRFPYLSIRNKVECHIKNLLDPTLSSR